MYSDRWSPQLRQGDIVGPVPLPLLGSTLKLIATQSSLLSVGTEAAASGSFIVEAKPAYAAILSHDCEFNEGKAARIVLARVQTVDRRFDEERMDLIRQSNDVRARIKANERIHGTDSFLLDPIEGKLNDRCVVSFNAIVTVSNTPEMLVGLARAKCAELVHEQRLLFKQKLAWFYVRGDDDLPADQKRPKEDVIAELASLG